MESPHSRFGCRSDEQNPIHAGGADDVHQRVGVAAQLVDRAVGDGDAGDVASCSTPCSTSDQNGLPVRGSSPCTDANKKPMLRRTRTGRFGVAPRPLAEISDVVDFWVM